MKVVGLHEVSGFITPLSQIFGIEEFPWFRVVGDLGVENIFVTQAEFLLSGLICSELVLFQLRLLGLNQWSKSLFLLGLLGLNQRTEDVVLLRLLGINQCPEDVILLVLLSFCVYPFH